MYDKNSAFYLSSRDSLLTALSYCTAHDNIVRGNVSQGTEG